MDYQSAPTPSYTGPASASASTSAAPPTSTTTTTIRTQSEPTISNNKLDRPPASTFAGTDIRSIKTACEFSLSEYLAQQRRRYHNGGYSNGNGNGGGDPSGEHRLRAQQGIVVSDLRALRSEVSEIVRRAEAHRWRKWLLGGLVASFIPTIRRIFRRPSSSSSSSSSSSHSSNDTEHAFRRSKSLIARILDSVHNHHGKRSKFASVAFFVLSILYVFESEVSIRVARTVSKRLKRLTARIERGDPGIGEEDMKVLKGWRWRVLLW
ncbi:uncharacterized protein GGS25DRAFT_517089 [Hypoxylon fragiforme]|uniref:uncharacterized protein n=1 Tax=Hypoxylon fragiforme TaxID=63214 RepID=UPI0020C6F157|nr:uncharacterized protein GGS25DRAFT_517089 [Hypoxylon fragiforme]KAI2614241.1 hypothetical protein GGS25DRAFT_517089 [Hypoxylon fragiforme]